MEGIYAIALLRHFNKSAIDDDAALCLKTLPVGFFVKSVKQGFFQAEVLELFGKEPDGLGVGNDVGKVQPSLLSLP